MLALDPSDWQAALRFKAATRAAGRYPDGEAAFRTAARHFPDDVWLDHYGSLYAFHGDDLPLLRHRGEAIAAAAPSPRLSRLLAAVARQQRDYAAAEAFLANLDDADTAELRCYRGLQARALSAASPYAVAAINLDRNPERWTLLQAEFGAGPPLRRIPGVLGSTLPRAAMARLGAADTPHGTLGCTLSHLAAWEWVLRSGVPHALVIEDDVQPAIDLPPGLGDLGIPDGCDLVFVNDQMASLPPTDAFRCVPLDDAMASMPLSNNAAGAYGYVVSAAGARRLLEWTMADGLAGDIDWRMILYAMSPAALDALPRPGEPAAALDRLRGIPQRTERLRAAVLHPPLIRSVAITSDREDENRNGEALP